MSHPYPAYPDHAMRWPDGTEIPTELKSMLLARVAPEFDIEHADLMRTDDGSIEAVFRLSVGRSPKHRQVWQVTLAYPADETTAFAASASEAEREWFAMMLRTHLIEWWETGASTVVINARRCK
jgi:hypothetical protein